MLKNKINRLTIGLLALVILAFMFTGVLPKSAYAIDGPSASEISSALYSRVNSFRDENGKDDMTTSPCVAAAATLWSQRMFEQNGVSNPTGGQQVDDILEEACLADGDWDGFASITITSPDTEISEIANSVLNTSSHREALLLDGNYIGIGIQPDDDQYYISVFFVRCDSGCGDFTKAVAAPAELALDSNGGPDDGGGDTRQSCESAGGLGWILCPVVNALDGFFNWVDSRIQELLNVEESKYRDENLEQTWRNIRNLAYVVLIPIMLVMVIGTAVGFSFIDAYTVKRALPRLIAATLFIALSWEITGFLIEVSNELGQGVLGLMTAPLDISAGSDGVTLQDLYSPSFGGGLIQGSFVGILGLFLATSALTGELLAVLFGFLTVAALIILTAFLVLITRQLFILALMVFAPIAIIAWIFPGNDKLWKLWWGTFSKLLLMFPIITALIGAGRVFAFIVGNADSSGFEGAVFNPLLKLVAYVIPYGLIPLTMKFAGGILGTLTGMVNDREKGLFDRLRKSRQPRYERMGRQVLQKRADMSRNLLTSASMDSRTKFGRGLRRFAAGRVGGYNIEQAAASRVSSVDKELNDIVNAGPDDDVRGLTAKYAFDMGFDRAQASGVARVSGGKRQYKSLGGAWIDEANVISGVNRWGNDRFFQQAAVSYEMRKVQDEGQAQQLAQNYHHLTQAWGMSEKEAYGAWIGSAFQNQNQHLEYKYTDTATGQLKTGGSYGTKGHGLVEEIYNKRGSYNLAQMGPNTIEQLKVAHSDAVAKGDIDTQQKIAAISETFMHELGTGGPVGFAEGSEEPIMAGGSSRRTASTPGAAAVAERVRELAGMTGVATDLNTGTPGSAPSGGYTAPGHAPTPQRREQK